VIATTNETVREFVARHATGARVDGIALVAKDGFSARYDLDRIQGVFSRPSHKLAGQSYRDRILVLDAAKGGVATAWMLHEMKSRGLTPLALVFNAANPIMAQGAALADLPMLAGFDCDITMAVPSGARVEVIPERRLLRVLD
jgi:predicted aconitase with swiveling domain